VQSLVFGAPALTFIVKTAEPLSTALLAVLVLKRPFRWPLLLGVLLACIGIMVSVHAANDAHSAGSTQVGSMQMVGMAFAFLSNLAFSSRACVAKKAISHLHVDPFETYAMLTIVGAQAGILPLLTYGLSSHVVSAGFTPGSAFLALPCFDSHFSAHSWFMMCLSYMLYQTCSVLVLSSIAVESHSLLVAMKHMLVVVLVSILVHAHLTRGIVFGMALTAVGVYLYMATTKEESSSAKEEVVEDATCKIPLQKVAPWQVPTILRVIVLAIVLIGGATPLAIAASGFRSEQMVQL